MVKIHPFCMSTFPRSAPPIQPGGPIMRHLNSKIQLEDIGQVDNIHQYHPFRDAKDYYIPIKSNV